MSMRGDAGRCRDCSTVRHIDDLVELSAGAEVEYLCPDCRQERT